MKYRKKRLEEIINYLKLHPYAEVEQLSGMFNVSPITIRRDLKALEQEKHIQRVGGGALMLSMEGAPDSGGDSKPVDPYLDEKLRIANQAMTMISEGDTIFMDGGTTNREIARRIAKDFHQLTVVTNSIEIAYTLYDKKQISIYVCGGIMNGSSSSQDALILGPIVEQMFSSFRANISFLGTLGIHPTKGVTCPNLSQSRIKNLMMNNSSCAVLVFDSSKLGKICPAFVCPVSQYQRMITDTKAPADGIEEIRAAGVRVDLV
jgi:DeoR/GlpR family transcriptional regulator of sugar metabolism